MLLWFMTTSDNTSADHRPVVYVMSEGITLVHDPSTYAVHRLPSQARDVVFMNNTARFY